MRELTATEKAFAKQVFLNTMPYERIKCSDELGAEDRPWMQEEETFYILNMGPIAYPDLTSKLIMAHRNVEVRDVFVHELTHVWQAFNENKWVFTRSVCSYIITWGGDYSTTEGLNNGWKWDKFNVEQQARIVEEWYSIDKMAQSGTRWNYINSIIHKKPRIFKPFEFQGIWEVKTNGQTFCYWLQDGGYCKWYKVKPVTLTKYAPYSGKGEWEIENDKLKINWDSGDKETWFLPIINNRQNGNWHTTSGPIHAIFVKFEQKL